MYFQPTDCNGTANILIGNFTLNAIYTTENFNIYANSDFSFIFDNAYSVNISLWVGVDQIDADFNLDPASFPVQFDSQNSSTVSFSVRQRVSSTPDQYLIVEAYVCRSTNLPQPNIIRESSKKIHLPKQETESFYGKLSKWCHNVYKTVLSYLA